MVHIPDSLAWELVKKHTSFMHKRNGKTARTGSVHFSVEKGNLKSISSYKYSGLANTQTVDVLATADNKAVLRLKVKSKGASQPKKSIIEIPIKKDFRRVENTIRKNALNPHYRPDLTDEALAKWTQVYRSNRIAKKIKKTIPVKKGRGKKY